MQSVEIRDVNIPKELEDAMSRRAQAERERQARIILGTAETEISDKFAQAAQVYRDNPIALHLRAMNMLYEAIKEKGSMVIVAFVGRRDDGAGGHAGHGVSGRVAQTVKRGACGDRRGQTVTAAFRRSRARTD